MKEILNKFFIEKNHHSVCDATYNVTLEAIKNITVSKFIKEIEVGHGYGVWGSVYIIKNIKRRDFIEVAKYKDNKIIDFSELTIRKFLDLKIEKIEVNYGWGMASYDLYLERGEYEN